ncbi:hypothetical protein [Mycoplasmopsis felis]|uniref:hypothetical protein n=1 Tax=Mycoplasmopsis felis TaxID=33923 RepID=UPI002AF6AC7C|nr:hypothetical protein [Mycoplasmopsis felis]WQQ02540.1 hypothetical protein RNN91_00465 [Mycoplasmopsis felis]WQQ06707.1 hypothetical protein RRG37_02530 [Mycoplasmopsis felis]WQQ10482.1 hypothetical protein RRG49_01965 [Mycoplasmopsis felis]
MILKKYLKNIGIITSLGIGISTISASCSDYETKQTKERHDKEKPKTSEDRKEIQNRIGDIDFTEYGVAKFSGNVKTRTLLFPAQTGSNNLDRDGVFHISLHLSPVKDATGDWYAFAAEVISSNNNTLVKPVVIKKSLTTAKEGAEFPLRWQFTDENKLEDGKSYTFIFWKTDGSEVIVFSKSNIENNKDIFPARLPR